MTEKNRGLAGALRGVSRRSVIAGLGATLAFGTALPLSAQRAFAQAAGPTGDLVVGFRSNPSALDPHVGTGGNEHTILYTMFDTLVRTDDEFRPQPGLAESWALGDNELVLTLRQGIKFHDGTDFNAAAVKWNLERILDPETVSAAAGSISEIDVVTEVDERTVSIRTKQPFSPLLLNLSDRAGMMISPASAEGGADIRRNPVGTGPFRFREWLQDDRVVVDAFEDYWDEEYAARVASITFRLFADEAPMVAGLQTGEIHLARLAPASVPILESLPEMSIETLVGAQVLGLRGNTDEGPLADKNARLAVSHAIDRDQLVDFVYRGGAVRGDSIISPAHAWAYDPSFQGPQRDLEKAREYLSQSSTPDGFELVIAAPSTIAEAVPVAQILQAHLAEIGVTVKINVTEMAQVVPSIRAATAHAQSSSFSIRPDPDGYLFEQYHSTGGFKYGNTPQPAIDPHLEAARQSFDIEERRQHYLNAQEAVVNTEATSIIWGYATAIWAVGSKVQNFDIGSEGKGRLSKVALLD